MKALALLLGIVTPLTGAVMELVPGPAVAAFGGGQRAVELILRNRTDANVSLALELQLLQANSATVAPWLQPRPWRSVALAPRQTSVERADIDLPSVREESPFLVRVVSGREVLGVLALRVYPHGILDVLTNGLGPVLVASISPELQRVLSEVGLTLLERGQARPSDARIQLAIYGSPPSATAIYAEALSLAKAGMSVVWIGPEDDPKLRTAPSYFSARLGKGTFVTVREETLGRLATDPMAQLRLGRILRLALGQETLNPLEPDL